MENVVNGGEPPVNEDVGENAPVVINDNGVQAVGELPVVINQAVGQNGVQAVSQNGVQAVGGLVGGEIVGEPPVQAGIEDIDAAELQILNNIQAMVVEEVVLGFILGLNENIMAEVAVKENVAVEENVASSVEAAVGSVASGEGLVEELNDQPGDLEGQEGANDIGREVADHAVNRSSYNGRRE